jgi:hypothetical protein
MNGLTRFFKRGITVSLLLSGLAYGQFRISEASWLSKDGAVLRYDKAEHWLGSAFLYQSLRVYKLSPGSKLLISIGAGFLWEVKDAYFPYEKYGPAGGDGFDFKDFFADCIGVLLSFEIEKYNFRVSFRPYLERGEPF